MEGELISFLVNSKSTKEKKCVISSKLEWKEADKAKQKMIESWLRNYVILTCYIHNIYRYKIWIVYAKDKSLYNENIKSFL